MPFDFQISFKLLNAVFSILLVWLVMPCRLIADSIEMVFIPSGTALIGDDSNLNDERPSRFVSTSEYFIDVFEVTVWDWEKVATWAESNGYQFSDSVKRRKDGPWWYRERSNLLFPMNMTDWYDAVKWCNARSELEGRTPVYYEDANKTVVYRSGNIDLNESNVNWMGTGYRPRSNGRGRPAEVLRPQLRITVGAIHF